MIRFFRSIRQRLLAQGRLTRFLIHAMGEPAKAKWPIELLKKEYELIPNT
jgi:hypothetical protein